MNEQWIKWQPIPGLEGQYSLEELCEGIHGFEIILINSKDRTKKIRVLWKNWVESFAKLQGDLVTETKTFLDEQYGAGFHESWSFFMVEDSAYLKKLSEESGILSDSYDVIHFALITPDSIIHIIPTCEPKVSWITEDLLAKENWL